MMSDAAAPPLVTRSRPLTRRTSSQLCGSPCGPGRRKARRRRRLPPPRKRPPRPTCLRPLPAQGSGEPATLALTAKVCAPWYGGRLQTIGVDPKLGLTILSLESNDGVSLNSGKGARGPMQLLPETAARYGVTDICDPEQNVRGGLLFLKDLVDQFQGNMMLVAAAYDAGPERVYERRRRPCDRRDGSLRRERCKQILRPERLRGPS